MNNILLIAGTGRNVGKTLLACEIISHLSKTTDVLGIKISSHLHELEKGQKIIANTPNYQISEELMETGKDSSRMKQAGAKKVFYIQARQENLKEAFLILIDEIAKNAIVCESGGLHQFIKPGLFFLVRGNEIPENKKHYLEFNPLQVNYTSSVHNIDVSHIRFCDNCFNLNLKSKD